MKSPKKKSSSFRKWLIILLLPLNIVVALALLGAFINQFVPPTGATRLAFLGLAFPYLLVVNLLFSVLWLFLKYPFCIISLIPILFNINNIDRHYQLKGNPKPARCLNCVKVMSFNVKLFGLYNSDNRTEQNASRQEIINFLEKEKPNILCLQEYFYENGHTHDFPTKKPVLSALGLEDNTRYYYQHFTSNHKQESFYGMAIFSRYPIMRSGAVQMPDSSAVSAIFADIRYKKDTIRVYCVHAASIHLEKPDYLLGKQIMETQFSDPRMNRNVLAVLSKFNKTFQKRRFQAEALRAHIDSCQLPIIVCGDFNDTPASYAYSLIAKRLKDSFRESGVGKGLTFHSEAFPSYRIDYILHSKAYNDYNHTIHTEMTVSDHYPVSTVISLQK
jgi:endonuclease/exonuclease/phosphatase family metal-dependent hydrolase